LTYVFSFFIFLIFIIFFTSTEISLISANYLRIKHLAKLGYKRAQSVLTFFSHPEMYFAAILIGTNLFVVAATVVAERALSLFFGLTGEILTTFVVSSLILVFGELIPKSLARMYADKVALTNFPFLRFFNILFFPFSIVIKGVSNVILFGVNTGKEVRFKQEVNRETLKWILDKTVMSEAMKKIDKRIFVKILRFSEKPVSGVMVPRVEMEMIEYPFKEKEVFEIAERTGFSRFPVYRKTPDKIIGVITVKDMFRNAHKRISEVIKPIKFVPPNKRCDLLLTELKDEITHMAIVVNEFGETEGLVTLEDLVEEVFGEIIDEFDRGLNTGIVKKLDKTHILIKGTCRIEEINEELPINIPEGDYDTVSGYIMDRIRGLPTEDTVVNGNGYRLIVKEMVGQKIKSVLIEILNSVKKK